MVGLQSSFKADVTTEEWLLIKALKPVRGRVVIVHATVFSDMVLPTASECPVRGGARMVCLLSVLYCTCTESCVFVRNERAVRL